MASVDPRLEPIPEKFLNEFDTRVYFENLERFLHDLWLRTGGGDDAISGLQLGELYEPGIQTFDPAETQVDDLVPTVNDLLERVKELETDLSIWVNPENEEMEPLDYYHEVAAGRVPGASYVHKFGRNPDIDTASGFESIWNGGGDYTGFNATAAEIVTLSSSDANDTSAGTGARTVQVYGLDASYVEQNEIVTLSGTTLVDTVNSYIRLDRMIVRSAGSGGQNAGTITAAQKVTTANIFASMPIGYNQTMICALTVPAGKKAFIKSWGAALAGKTTANCNVRLVMRPFNEVYQVKEELSIMGAGNSYVLRQYDVDKDAIPEKTDIHVMADTDTNNTALSATIDIIYEDV